MSASTIQEIQPDAPERPAARGWSPEYLRLQRGLMGAAFLVCGLCLLISPVRLQDWRGLGIIVSLAVIVSLMPVRLPSHSITVSPVLPIVFAAACLFGATAAILVTVISMAIVGLVMLPKHKAYRLRKFSLLVTTPVVADGFPVLLYTALQAAFFPPRGDGLSEFSQFVSWVALSACSLLAFISSYLVSTFLSSRYYGTRWNLIWHDNARWNMLSGLLMSPVAFVAAVLYREHWWLGVLFILIPTWAAHAVVVYHERTMGAYKMGVELLGRIMQESHPYTHGHLNRVAHWAKKIAEDLQLPPESMQFIEDAAILHDIGKVAVDDRVLNKVGKLSDDDWAMIRRHPVVGAEIVGHIRHYNKAAHWIRHHHERPDGGGYPSGMADGEVPIEACIISVVDAYDAMVGGPAKEDKRPYREPMASEAAVAELRRHAGTQFDRRVVEAFVGILSREQVLAERGEQPAEDLAAEGDSLWDAPLTTAAAYGVFVSAGGSR